MVGSDSAMDVDSNVAEDSHTHLHNFSVSSSPHPVTTIGVVRPDPARALPTRVSKACARCRRQKIRCDSYRPCSLCVRAQVTCVPIPERPRSYKWPKGSNSRNTSRSIRDRSHVDDAPLVLAEGPRSDSFGSPATNSTRQFIPEGDGDSVASAGPLSSGTLHDSPTSVYQDAQSAMDITRKIIRMHGRNVVERTTSAIPDGQDQAITASRRQSFSTKRETHCILGISLPPKQIMDELLEEYFDSVHWFSLIIYEPTFRRQYSSVADGYAYESQKGFLLLLATVLGIASWYRAKTTVSNSNFGDEDWDGWRVRLFAVAESRFLELMDERILASLQTCLLLGTYHVYHGRPNASLALLGATIKIAQAMGLHRESVGSSPDENEERKRVWWTIYTWDRFASITYGRPLGINDSDCNVSMPADINELARPETANQEGVVICFSTYQSQLSKLYMIASPLIKTIFGLRISSAGKESFNARYTMLMEDISQRLTSWCDQLPPSLRFNFDYDVPLEASLEQKVYQRQALALQLTYDNILIILHRPVMAQHVDSLCRTTPASTHEVAETWHTTTPSMSEKSVENFNFSSSIDSSQQWWDAAIRISNVTKLPNTAQLATDSHLVGFLAIILFNSAIVMVVYALSDPLSDRAQEAKRNLTRILRLENLLGKRSSLSRQSGVILQDVIQLLLDREAQAMLGPTCNTKIRVEETTHGSSSLAGYQSTVGDALRDPLPTNLQSNPGNSINMCTNPGVNEVLRLNESLSFVQKAVFPVNDTEEDWSTPAMPSAHQHESFGNSSYSDGWPPTNAYEIENPGSYPEAFGAIDNGIYWIWEPS